MSDNVVFLIIALFVVVTVAGWLIYLGYNLILAFTVFVMGLPLIFMILLFVLFPPSFIVFLIGLVLIGIRSDSD